MLVSSLRSPPSSPSPHPAPEPFGKCRTTLEFSIRDRTSANDLRPRIASVTFWCTEKSCSVRLSISFFRLFAAIFKLAKRLCCWAEPPVLESAEGVDSRSQVGVTSDASAGEACILRFFFSFFSVLNFCGINSSELNFLEKNSMM